MEDVQPSELKRLGQMPGYLAGVRQCRPRKNMHKDLHDFVDETRKLWGETAKEGIGSFGWYLGKCKGFSVHELHVIRDRVSDKARSPAMLFFWMLEQERKRRETGEQAT